MSGLFGRADESLQDKSTKTNMSGIERGSPEFAVGGRLHGLPFYPRIVLLSDPTRPVSQDWLPFRRKV